MATNKKLIMASGGAGIGWALDVNVAANTNSAGIDSDSSDNIYTILGLASLCKVDVDGAEQWRKSVAYSDSGADLLIGVHTDTSGNIFASGRKRTSASGYYGSITQKWNSSGTYVDEFCRTASPSSEGRHSFGVSDGTYYYVPEANEASERNGFQVIRISDMEGYSLVSASAPSNNRLMSTEGWTFSYITQSFGSRCFLDSSGNIILIGPYDDGTGDGIKISRFTSSGTLSSSTEIEHTDGSTTVYGRNGMCFAMDDTDNIYMALQGSYLVKVNSSGTIVWQKQFDGTPDFHSIDIDSDGDLHIVANQTSGAEQGSYHFCVSSSGSVVFKKILTKNSGYSASVSNVHALSQDDKIVMHYNNFIVNIPKNENGTWYDGVDTYEIDDTTNYTLSTATDLSASSVSLTYSEYSGSLILSVTETVSDDATGSTLYDII